LLSKSRFVSVRWWGEIGMKLRIGMVVLVVASAAVASPALASAALVGYWNLNEGSGTRVADSSGFGNNGVLYSYGNAQWVPGFSGTGLSFTGGFAAVQVKDSPSLDPTTVSVAVWVKSDSSPGDFRYIIDKGAYRCIAGSYGLYTGPAGGMMFYIAHNDGADYMRSPDAGDAIWNGAWHLVVGTFDGSTLRLYVDGRQIGSGTSYPGAIAYDLPASNDLFIGSYPNCSMRTFTGMIDEVKIWNEALSQADVDALLPETGSPYDIPPAISHLKLSPTSFREVGHRSSKGRRRRPTKTTISYRDTEAATATLTVALAQSGVRRGGRCVKRTARTKAHARRCTRWVKVTGFKHHDVAGSNRFQVKNLVGRKSAVGRYRLEATPRAHGLVGRTRSAGFRVRG
jgi:Concanavalin A-like lectin/glucanases superfamily